MDPDELADREWRPDLAPIADRAGAAIMGIYTSADFGVEEKADKTPLTDADLAAQKVILEGLSELDPELPILSEEAEDEPYATRRDWDALWVVDPLDGTKEFIKRNGEFTVNIALVVGARPVAGIVHVPALDETYFGRTGGDARRRTDGSWERIATDPLDADGPTRVVASRSHMNEATRAFVEDLDDAEVIRSGSSLKFCRIAEGAADLYPRFAPTMEWDTAAAQAVLEAAGGTVRKPDGAPLRYNKESLRNPHFVAAGDPAWFD